MPRRSELVVGEPAVIAAHELLCGAGQLAALLSTGQVEVPVALRPLEADVEAIGTVDVEPRPAEVVELLDGGVALELDRLAVGELSLRS